MKQSAGTPSQHLVSLQKNVFQTLMLDHYGIKIFYARLDCLVEKQRGEKYIDQDESSTLDWTSLKEKVAKYGMRNLRAGNCSNGNHRQYLWGNTIHRADLKIYLQNPIYLGNSLVAPDLVRKLGSLNLWDEPMVQALKISNGSVQAIERIPKNVRDMFKTAFEVDTALVEAASRRAKWIDQANHSIYTWRKHREET